MLKLPNNPLAHAIAEYVETGAILEVDVQTLDAPRSPIEVRLRWNESTHRDYRTDAPGMPTDLPPDDKPLHLSSVSRRAETVIECDYEWYLPRELQTWVEATCWTLGGGYIHRHFTPPSGDAARGTWRWFFNSAYQLHRSTWLAGAAHGFANRWLAEDPTRHLNGSRSGDFPGWHPNEWQTLADTYETNYEDHVGISTAWDMNRRVCDPSLIFGRRTSNC